MSAQHPPFFNWSEMKAKFHLIFLIKKRKMKEHLAFKNSHEYQFEHDVQQKKCCYNQKRRKTEKEKAKFMAVNSDKCKSKCVSKARRNGLAALNPAVHIILSAGVNCYAKGANTMGDIERNLVRISVKQVNGRNKLAEKRKILKYKRISQSLKISGRPERRITRFGSLVEQMRINKD